MVSNSALAASSRSAVSRGVATILAVGGLGVRLAAAMAILAAAPASGQQPQQLFDGTLARWSVENTTAGNISVQGGVLRVAGSAGWLKSAQTYADFVLRTEFRFVTDDADSGIFIRTVADSEFGPGWPGNGYQVQMRNPVSESRFPAVGGIFRHGTPPGETSFDAALAAQTSTGTGEWQELEIVASGETLEVRLNGTLLTRASGIVHPRGHIGLQAETGVIEFRSIEIATED